jgi:hypothetical protein
MVAQTAAIVVEDAPGMLGHQMLPVGWVATIKVA